MKSRVLSICDIPVHVEVADTQESRQLGLMHRSYLSQDTGMLFVFQEPQQLGFWMKNTRIPLSIAFISSEGEILNIEDMLPYDMSTARSSNDALYALEVPMGWFTSKGIKSGDYVEGVPEVNSLMSESHLRNLIRRLL